MAITIHNNPPNPAPVHNPMVFKVSSDNANEEQFSVIADISVHDELITRLRIPLNPDGFAVFDAHKHIQNEIELNKSMIQNGAPSALTITNFGNLQASGGFATYSVNLSEEYKAYIPFSEVSNASGNAYLVTQTTPIFEVGDLIDVVTSDVASYNQTTTITNIVENFPDYYIYTTLAYNGDASGTYSLSNNELTIFPTGASVSNYFAWDAAFDWEEFLYRNNFSIGTPTEQYFKGYFGNGTSTNNNFSTNMPNGWEVDRNSAVAFNIVYDPSEYTQLYQYMTFDTGATNSNHELIYGPTAMSLVAFGPRNTNPPFDNQVPEDVSSVQCEIRDDEGNVVFGPITYTITDNCTKYERVTLIFKDQKGSYIPFSFDLVSRHTKDIERTTYSKERALESVYGNVVPRYTSYKRGKTTIDTKVTDRYTITSNWVNQTTSDYLMELFESPDVFWYEKPGIWNDYTLTPITITDTSVERKKTINDLIINYTLSFEMSVKNPKIR